MCLIVFAYHAVPGYPLILAANRDEFYGRPTKPAHFWDESPDMLAGKDLKAGGTWLGVHKDGRFAALTNYRNMGAFEQEAKSRGFLVKDFLQAEVPAADYLESLDRESDLYNGFNLLVGDTRTLYHYSNVDRELSLIRPGIHGISNALMNTSWPKVEETKKDLEKLVSKNGLTEGNLFSLLLNKKRYPSDLLPNTGLPEEMEKAVSANFIQTPEYGTRSSTLLLIRENGDIRFTERTYTPGTTVVQEQKSHKFKGDLPSSG